MNKIKLIGPFLVAPLTKTSQLKDLPIFDEKGKKIQKQSLSLTSWRRAYKTKELFLLPYPEDLNFTTEKVYEKELELEGYLRSEGYQKVNLRYFLTFCKNIFQIPEGVTTHSLLTFGDKDYDESYSITATKEGLGFKVQYIETTCHFIFKAGDYFLLEKIN